MKLTGQSFVFCSWRTAKVSPEEKGSLTDKEGDLEPAVTELRTKEAGQPNHGEETNAPTVKADLDSAEVLRTDEGGLDNLPLSDEDVKKDSPTASKIGSADGAAKNLKTGSLSAKLRLAGRKFNNGCSACALRAKRAMTCFPSKA